ncbi:MAG: hypothetical protein JW730_09880 [Anaerolineales bacterium]|nr:hypothetical protein [Anaerolineales bacterium]
MSIGDLYAELGVDFQPDDRQKFLQEFADVARDYQSHLGPAEGKGIRTTQLEELAAELGKDVVTFSPQLTALALSKKMFTDLKLEVPPAIASLLRRYDFYLVNFPITVHPRPGGGFVQLESIVEFNPGSPPKERPIAYQIFPQDEWQSIIHAWQGVRVGLNESFEFKIDPIQAASGLPALDSPAKAAIELKLAGKAGLVFGPFDYDIRRPKIVGRGQGNVKVYWRMESEEAITQEQPCLGVVLQVPKDVPRVDINGVLKALPTFHYFTAEVRNLAEFMSSLGANFFKKGAPVTHDMVWEDITAGVN